MKIVVINPPIRLTDKPRHIPHGLAILANIIRKRIGVEPTFIDVNAHRYDTRTLEAILASIDFDVVLIGGLIPVYKRIVEYAEMIKRIRPAAVIIAGGSAGMSVPEILLDNSKVDAVCTGEGEKAIVDLLRVMEGRALADITAIKGFCYKVRGRIVNSGSAALLKDLDTESSLPAYDLLPMDVYLANPVVGFGKDVDFISSRGCPYGCTFCYQPWGRRFRGHSVDFIIDAVRYLKKKYAIDFLSFQDDEFMADRKRVLEFCERVKGDLPSLLWSCTGRANLIDDDIAGRMRGAGCVSISYGFESGSPRMLKAMKKGVSIDDMEEAVRVSRRHGLMLPVSFIIGMPGEDDRSCAETVEFCVRNDIHLKSIMFATPYPGTELFDFAVSTGRIRRDRIHDYVVTLEDARDFTVNLTDAFTDEQLIEKRRLMTEEVSSRIKAVSDQGYREKMRSLFGSLADRYAGDEAMAKHRAEHGGMDIF